TAGFIKDAIMKTELTKNHIPGSRKVYVQGSRPELRVPFRRVELSATQARSKARERAGDKTRDSDQHQQGQGQTHLANPAVDLYDTSGPYTDPEARIDLERGLSPLRRPWILERGDVKEVVAGGRPLRARAGQNVTQMHYARRGLITPEME